jgi:hypothetical protein
VFRGNRYRLAALAGLIVLALAATALTGHRGSYNGVSLRGHFTIKIQTTNSRVTEITIGCRSGTVTVESAGPSVPILDNRFSYHGQEASTLHPHTTLTMSVTGGFAGTKVSGFASTDAECLSGSYLAAK